MIEKLSDLGTAMTQVAYLVEGRWPMTYDQQRKRELLTVGALVGFMVIPLVILNLQGTGKRT